MEFDAGTVVHKLNDYLTQLNKVDFAQSLEPFKYMTQAACTCQRPITFEVVPGPAVEEGIVHKMLEHIQVPTFSLKAKGALNVEGISAELKGSLNLKDDQIAAIFKIIEALEEGKDEGKDGKPNKP
jgi:hypothetical protein